MKHIKKFNESYEIKYSGVSWKHHISKDFENRISTQGGAGKGGTIFTDYEKMIKYLKKDGRKWHIAELKLKDEPLIFEFGNSYMTTIQRDFSSKEGFKPLII